MRALVILEARAAEVSVPPVSRRKAGVRDVRTLGYVHRMMHYIGTSKGAGVPRVVPGELGPFGLVLGDLQSAKCGGCRKATIAPGNPAVSRELGGAWF